MTDLTLPFSLYIHFPFCRHRCAYCDFNTYAGQEDAIPAYVDALRREIEFTATNAPVARAPIACTPSCESQSLVSRP